MFITAVCVLFLLKTVFHWGIQPQGGRGLLDQYLGIGVPLRVRKPDPV